MTSVLSSFRATAYRNPLIATLILVLLSQVIMVDIPNARDQRIAALQTWFHTSNEDGPVDEDGIQAFLDEVANVHFTPIVAADGRAAAIYAAGYSSVHDIAGITNSELQQMGFVQGNAKRLSSYFSWVLDLVMCPPIDFSLLALYLLLLVSSTQHRLVQLLPWP